MEENVEIPQLRFALLKGKLRLTPGMVLQEILQGWVWVLLILFMCMKASAKKCVQYQTSDEEEFAKREQHYQIEMERSDSAYDSEVR